jgi:hypothetical protein
MKANKNLVEAEQELIGAIWEALDKCEDGDLLRKSVIILGDKHPSVQKFRRAIQAAYSNGIEHGEQFVSLK